MVLPLLETEASCRPPPTTVRTTLPPTVLASTLVLAPATDCTLVTLATEAKSLDAIWLAASFRPLAASLP